MTEEKDVFLICFFGCITLCTSGVEHDAGREDETRLSDIEVTDPPLLSRSAGSGPGCVESGEAGLDEENALAGVCGYAAGDEIVASSLPVISRSLVISRRPRRAMMKSGKDPMCARPKETCGYLPRGCRTKETMETYDVLYAIRE